MNEEQKKKVIADAENVEALKDFFLEWWTVEELYETAANAALSVLHILQTNSLCNDDKESLQRLMNQHMVMIEHMKPFAENGKEGQE